MKALIQYGKHEQRQHLKQEINKTYDYFYKTYQWLQEI